MKIFLFALAFSLLNPSAGYSFVLPTRLILQKTTENAGSGAYVIEQDVQFTNENETINLRESWLIENENSMRLMVSAGKESTFKLQFLYSGGQKFSLINGNRVSEKTNEDFFEKYFNFRSVESLYTCLNQNKILPIGAIQKKGTTKNGIDYKYEDDPWVRLSRTGGTTTYALGTPTQPDQESNNPGIWIAQDEFVIRKLRLPSQVEVSANNYAQFARGLMYPRQRVVRWKNNTATIKLLSVNSRQQSSNSPSAPFALDTPSNWEGLPDSSSKEAVMEFYKRFR